MYRCPKSFRPRGGTRGIALIVVLSMVAVIAVLLAAFSGVMNTDRSASFSYSQSLRAEQMGKGCLQLVIADLQSEMSKDGLPDVTYPTKPLFTNVTGTNLLPQVTGSAAGIDSLVKISGTTPSFTGSLSSGTVLLSSTVSSTSPSFNGRFVDLKRWNYPAFGDFTQNASAPRWVILTRNGSTSGTGATFGSGSATLNNPAPSNANYAIGRFAYAVYDEGGLLDITVAGYPPNLSPAALQALKGTLAGADLSKLGIDAQKLVQWRNAAHSGTADYVALMTGTGAASASGYKQVAPGDTTFLSRQDLIQAAKSGTAGLSGTSVLKYLTTFTRERNAPSWRPKNPVGITPSINYTTAALNASSTNPYIPLVRYSDSGTITAYKIDGYTTTQYDVQPGDPVVYRRFPLDRIRWIGPTGPRNGATDAAIQAHFGLKWDKVAGVWHYYGSTGTTEQAVIKTLSAVAAETPHREPNFFELLQAGILAGSLGGEHHLNDGGTKYTFNYWTKHEQSTALHVFRIGASILSQYEESCNPVVVSFASTPGSSYSWQACGDENLPYLNMLHCLVGANSSSSLASYLMFGLWNPHQGTVASRPSIRLRGKGSVALQNQYARNMYPIPVLYGATSLTGVATYSLNPSDCNVELSGSTGAGSNGFTDPHAILPGDLAQTAGAGTSTGMAWAKLPSISGTNYVGFRLPDFAFDPNDAPTDTSLTADTWGWVTLYGQLDVSDPLNFWLEYKNPDGVWVPYTFHAGINDSATWFAKTWKIWCGYMGPGYKGKAVTSGTPAVATGTNYTYYKPSPQMLDPKSSDLSASSFYAQKYVFEITDPRSLRFNYTNHQVIGDLTWSTYLGSSIWCSSEQTNFKAHGRYGPQAFQQYFNAQWNHAGLCRNNTTPPGTPGINGTGAAYTDPDGVQRIADSGLFTSDPTTGGNWEGVPYATSTTRAADRPIILNRPFYSVGELGYVNRDYPWRTLDFFTAKSADSGLLDLFTTSSAAENVVAGRIQLNTKNSTALKAVLGNTVSNELDKTPLSNPDQIADDLVAFTGSGATPAALVGRDEIATKFLPSIDSTRFGTANSLGNTDEGKIKSRREATVRALADVAQTRTWNLMIDLIVQAGRYPNSAKSADQFVVEGERRYWLHVAIDRFTGEIVDQQLEPVYQ